MYDDTTNERDELDSLLDAALATYVDAEARPGLAHGILAVTSRREPRRLLIRWLPVGVPALAAVLLIAVFVAHRVSSPAESAPAVARLSSSASGPDLRARSTPQTSGPQASSPPVRSDGRRREVKVVTTRQGPAPLPRLEVFPTPTALTAEEKTMLAVANRGSKEVAAQVAESATRSEEHPVEPIHIAAIHIPPLNPPDNGSN